MQERWSYSTSFGKCSIHYAYIYIFSVLSLWYSRFGSTVVIKCAHRRIMPKVKQPNSSKVQSILHEYTSEFTSTPQDELFYIENSVTP